MISWSWQHLQMLYGMIGGMEISYEKCGIRLNPPAFVAIYRKGEKLKKKVMPLRNFTSFSNIEYFASDLKNRHSLNEVPIVKIEKLLRLLQLRSSGLEESKALEKIQKEYAVKVNEDLNKLSTDELDRQKKLMDSLFLKNQIKKEDNNFIYNKEVEFLGEKEKSDWDTEEGNSFWD